MNTKMRDLYICRGNLKVISIILKNIQVNFFVKEEHKYKSGKNTRVNNVLKEHKI